MSSDEPMPRDPNNEAQTKPKRQRTRRGKAAPQRDKLSGSHESPPFPPLPQSPSSSTREPMSSTMKSRPKSPNKTSQQQLNASEATTSPNGPRSKRNPSPYRNDRVPPHANFRPHDRPNNSYRQTNRQVPSSFASGTQDGSAGQSPGPGTSRIDLINSSLNAKYSAMQPQPRRYNQPWRQSQNVQATQERPDVAAVSMRADDVIQRVEAFNRARRERNAPLHLDPAEIIRREEASLQGLRRSTVQRVDVAIRRAFGEHFRVELFGSTFYGVSSAKSDLDLVIVDSLRMNGFPPSMTLPLPKVYKVREVAKILLRAGFRRVMPVVSAAVPIVKFVDDQNGFECDINVNNQLGLVNSMMLKNYCDMSPVLRPMLRLLKGWAKPLALNNPSGVGPRTFSSYGLSLMTIGFLQSKNLLPNLQANLPPLNPGVEIAPGVFWVKRRNTLMKCDTRWTPYKGTFPGVGDIQVLMKEWFQYWATEFDYQENMVSIRKGGITKRPIAGPSMEESKTKAEDKGKGKEKAEDDEDEHDLDVAVSENAEQTPEESEPIREEDAEDADGGVEIENNTVRADEWKRHNFVVVDPFVRRQNVVAGVSETSLRRFRQECQRAIEVLDSGKSVEEMIEGLEPVVIKPKATKKKKPKHTKGYGGQAPPSASKND
ncbi:hypothetical protein ONZ45_g11236 [Pleurotus djamor]|nr:hypothetical protein ONZ45_g11236 [Pleurotus djamor]